MKCSDFRRMRERDDPMMHVSLAGRVLFHTPSSRVSTVLKRSGFVAVVDSRGVVRIAHARYAFEWWGDP